VTASGIGFRRDAGTQGPLLLALRGLRKWLLSESGVRRALLRRSPSHLRLVGSDRFRHRSPARADAPGLTGRGPLPSEAFESGRYRNRGSGHALLRQSPSHLRLIGVRVQRALLCRSPSHLWLVGSDCFRRPSLTSNALP
jgi:hypothetical protein